MNWKLLLSSLFLLLVVAPLAHAQYCGSQSMATGFGYISRVQLGAIDQSSDSTDYSDYTNDTTNVARGQNYTLTVDYFDNLADQYMTVWFDWNQDESFAGGSEEVNLLNMEQGSSVSANISVPAGAALGDTRFRIILSVDGLPSSCEDMYSEGETEDYNVSVTVADVTSPRVTINFPTNGATYTASDFPLNFNITLDENGTVDYTLNGGTTNISMSGNGTHFNHTNASVPDGSYTFNVYANDTAGNTNLTESVSFTVDGTEPTLAINSPSLYETGSVIIFNVTLNENGSVWYTLNGSNTNSSMSSTDNQTFNASNSTLTEGDYTVTFYANDTAGNTNSTSFNFTIDRSTPGITIVSPTASVSSSSSILFNVTLTENATVWYSLNDSAVNVSMTSTNSVNFNATNASVPDGSYIVTFYANDSAGNLNSTTRNFSVDANPPTITVNSPTGITNNATIVLNITLNEIGRVTYSINNSSHRVMSTSDNFSFTDTNGSLSDGTYGIRFFANDSNGNNNSATQSFTLDSSAPSITINSPSSTLYNTSIITFNVTLGETGFAWYSLNDSSLNISMGTTDNLTFNHTNTSIPDGSYIVTFYANDSENNLASSTRNFTINTDLDGDGITDANDTIEGTVNDVVVSGVSSLNVTVNGTTLNGTATGSVPIVFQDAGTPLINFTHNFSSTELNLSAIEITVSSSSIIVNMSGQVAGGKTLYLNDNGFSTLCVKDAEISSVSEISSDCTGSNETNFDTCIGNSGGVTSNGITCYDEGSRFRIENLSYSGVRGGSSSSSSSSGGGGSNYRGKTTYLSDSVELLRMQHKDMFSYDHHGAHIGKLVTSSTSRKQATVELDGNRYIFELRQRYVFDLDENGKGDVAITLQKIQTPRIDIMIEKLEEEEERIVITPVFAAKENKETEDETDSLGRSGENDPTLLENIFETLTSPQKKVQATGNVVEEVATQTEYVPDKKSITTILQQTITGFMFMLWSALLFILAIHPRHD